MRVKGIECATFGTYQTRSWKVMFGRRFFFFFDIVYT
jgi:hypothetical protein